MKWKQMFWGISAAVCLFVSGCQDTGLGQSGNSPEDVVSKVLESQKKAGSYYAEGKMRIYNNNAITEDSSTKEWYDSSSGKRRIEFKSNNQEVMSINEGNQVITYDKTNNNAFSMKITDEMGLASMSQRDQLMNLLKSIQSTHKYQFVGNERVLGMDSYHVKVNANKPDTLFGDMDLWVDPKTWFILKSNVSTGDIRTESEYTKLDFSPKWTEDTFTLNIPKDVEIKPIEDMNPAKEVSIEDAGHALGQKFLVFNDEHFKLTKLDLVELKGIISRSDVEAHFSKDDVPSLTLSIFKTPEGADQNLGTETQVRQSKGWYMSDIHLLTWDEGGLRYSLIIENPDVSLEEVLKIAQNMQLSSK